MSEVQKPNTLKRIVRNEDGLIKGVNYIFTEDGTVDWRAMIPGKFLYINKEKTAETDITKCNDRDLVVTLAGIRYLAKLRGYYGYEYHPHTASEHYAAVKCVIKWRQNFETEDCAPSSEGVAGASLDNTSGFGRSYLIEMAGNRAFCRAVREFLNISIVSQEELSGKREAAPTEVPKDGPYIKLKTTLTDKGLDFAWLKEKLVQAKEFNGVENISEVEDIPAEKLLSILERVQKFKKKS